MRVRNLFCGVVFSLATTLSLLGSQASAQAQGALDGRAFSVVSTNPDEPYPDLLAFGGGTFESMGCRSFGFGAAPYAASAEGDAVVFTAEITSPTEGTMSWTGRVVGDSITGSYTWSKEGQEPTTADWAGAAAAGTLDGRSFHVALAGDPAEQDDLAFAMGGFESTGCRQYGFYPVAYTSETTADGSTAFNVTTYSFTEGMMNWTGTVTGDAVQGSYTWVKEGQAPTTVEFTGTAGASP